MPNRRKDLIVVFAQIILLYIICILSLINLTLFDANHDLWLTLLTYSISVLLSKLTSNDE